MIGIIGNGVIGNLVALNLSQNQAPWQWCDLRPLSASRNFSPGQQRSNGVMIQDQDTAANNPIALTAPVQQHLNGCTSVIICCKSYHLDRLSQQLTEHLSATLPVLLIHNGMLDPYPLARLERTVPIYMGIASMAGYALSESIRDGETADPFDKVVVRVNAGKLAIGPLPTRFGQAPFNQRIPSELEDLAHQLTPTEVTIHHDIRLPLYIKLAINACINLPCSWHDVKNGELTKQPELSQIVTTLAEEISQLYRCMGLDTASLTNQCLEQHAFNVATQTSDNSCSMREDIRNQRLTEVDSISGYLLAQAQRYAITLPCLSLYHRRIKTLEASYCA